MGRAHNFCMLAITGAFLLSAMAFAQTGGPAESEELAKSILQKADLVRFPSHDFEVAISEGATLVRIGTALFGERGARA